MAEDRSTSGNFRNHQSIGDEDIDKGSINEHNRDTEASLIESTLCKKVHEGNKDDKVIDIEKWVDSMTKILGEVPHYMYRSGHPGKISRIPEILRDVDLQAYEPYSLSIGPYHHGKEKLKHMEKRKHAALKCFLEVKPELNLKNCMNEIKSLEPAARTFYSDVEMDSEEFVLMLLLDSFYIVTSFCGLENCEIVKQPIAGTGSILDNEDTNWSCNLINRGMWTEDDNESTPMIPITNEQTSERRTRENKFVRPRWFWTMFMHDIFLIENQIPLFVLQKVYNLAYGGFETQFLTILKAIMADMLSEYTKLDSERLISPDEDVHHLLHLCHHFFRPTLEEETQTIQLPEYNQMFRLGSAVQLNEAGVIFKSKSCSTGHSLLDITFHKSGKIVMPCLFVDDNTNSLLRNLIALEQMKYPSIGLHVSAYVVLMLHLITSPEDVEFLRRKGIIQHHLASDKEMLYLINRLSVGLAFDYVQDSYSLKPIFLELKRYSEHRVPHWRAWLKHRYFSNPWTAISLLAASFLLLLCAVQTYYSLYSYYHPFFDGHS